MGNTHMPYPLGKLPADHLIQLLTRHAPRDDRVIVGPGIGRDAAVISFGDRYLVAKSDPVTFVTSDVGWYAVHVNANDIACMGATARWFLATLLLPEARTEAAEVDEIFRQITDACADLGIELVGGHTEITHGLDHPLVVGSMLGEVAPEDLVYPGDARPGDVLILTKGIAVEGTAIIARERSAALDGLDEAFLARCREFLHDPGISVVRDAAIATSAGKVHAMHDPTEGGLATGLRELAQAAGYGLEVQESDIPILPETQLLCERLKLDPLGLIASGSLLMAVAPDDSEAIQGALTSAGIASARIGRIVEDADRTVMCHDSLGERPLPEFARDEIARLFD
ncbi:MAG: hydrogenase expression protein [Chloroflexi bacterium]|nr:hydrogenase expression protein [Chloroflexota bacterium]